MSNKATTLAIKIVGDASNGIKALDDTDSRVGSFMSGNIGKLAGVVGGAFAVDKIVDFGKAAFDAASDLQQSSGAVEAIFGKQAAAVEASAAGAADAVGLSASAYDQMASIIGSQLKNAGTPADQLAGKVDGLVKKGADMSAVFGGPASDAVDALSSALKGEFDPIERYGVSLNQTAINSELAARGQSKLTGAALKTAQTQATLDIINKQTATTVGQFAAQSDTAAESQQRLGAYFDNVKARLGMGLLPVFSAAASFMHDKVAPAIDAITTEGTPFMNFLGSAEEAVKNIIPQVASFAQQVGEHAAPVLSSMGRIIADDVVPFFMTLISFIRDYGIPIFKAVLMPVLDGVSAVWHSLAGALDRNRDSFQKVYDNIKPFLTFLKNDVAPFVGGTLKLGFEALSKVLGPIIDSIAWVLDKGSAVVGFIGKIFGAGGGGGHAKSRGAAGLFGAAPGGALRGAGSSSLGGGAGPVAVVEGSTPQTVINVNVTGATLLDAQTLGDYLLDVIERRQARTGLRVAVAR